MYTPLKRIKGLRHRFGGEPPSGWLPSGAAKPRSTPVEELTVDLEIGAASVGGYLFFCRAPNRERSFDNWYETLEEAFDCGFDEFGVTPADWQDVSTTDSA